MYYLLRLIYIFFIIKIKYKTFWTIFIIKKKDIGIISHDGDEIIHNINVSNSYFKKGFSNWNYYFGGCLIVSDSKFENNTSEFGTIFNYPINTFGICIYADTHTRYTTVSNSTFINNTASKFGGVIYIMGNNNVTFTDCHFYNNNAKYGNIIYSNSKETLLKIDNLNSTDIATIPAHFEMCGKKVEKISILSGERIPEGIMCKFNKFKYKIMFIF